MPACPALTGDEIFSTVLAVSTRPEDRGDKFQGAR